MLEKKGHLKLVNGSFYIFSKGFVGQIFGDLILLTKYDAHGFITSLAIISYNLNTIYVSLTYKILKLNTFHFILNVDSSILEIMQLLFFFIKYLKIFQI